jgi:hypothetical protein
MDQPVTARDKVVNQHEDKTGERRRRNWKETGKTKRSYERDDKIHGIVPRRGQSYTRPPLTANKILWSGDPRG